MMGALGRSSIITLAALVGALAVTSAAQRKVAPEVTVFSVDKNNKIGSVLSNEPNTELIVDEGSNSPGVRLECNSNYPVQWVYSGQGVPVSEASVLTSGSNAYKAILRIATLTEQHTGKYKCSSVEEPDVLTYVYLYVPGSTLFVPRSGKPVETSTNQVVLPCTVSSPRVKVYLQKLAGPPLTRPGEYNPRRGYTIQVQEATQAEGNYICKGTYRGITTVLEYNVTIYIDDESPANIQGDRRTPELMSESDMPCNPPCAENAKCMLRGSFSECRCLQPFAGDGYRSCIDPYQRSTTSRPSTGGCTTHTDCPDDKSCFVDGVCRDPCTNSQHGLVCHTHGTCKTVNHQPTCVCKPGSYGDGFKSCSVPDQQGDAPVTDRPDRRTTSKTASKTTTTAVPPTEYEFICRRDAECGKGKICNGTMCMDPCENVCGQNAVCRVVNKTPLCSCRSGFRGDPWNRCEAETVTKVLDPLKAPPKTQICDTNADCPSKYVCESFKCTDPCTKCAEDAECDLYDGDTVPSCKCPEGFTGDGRIGCLQDLTIGAGDFFGGASFPAGAAPKEPESNGSPCSELSCGPHSECRVVAGLPKCNCQSGYIGSPPNCHAECSQNSECPDNKLCVQKRCRNACYGKCGKFARCRNNPDTKTQTCNCRRGYTGDPYTACVPVA